MPGINGDSSERYAAVLHFCSFPRHLIIVYQDHHSAVKLTENSTPPSDLTRHIEIGFSFDKDLENRSLISKLHCCVDIIIADFPAKPFKISLIKELQRKCGEFPYTHL